jgi:hypothetical protein
MTGGLMQLVACGAQDIFLTGSPMISYFKTVYRRHTNFAIETVKQTFDTPAGFGVTTSSTLSRNGDLITGAYIQASLPDLTEKNVSNFTGTTVNSNGMNNPARRYTRWVDNIGHYLIKSVEISIGGNTIDRHYSDWLEIWAQLTVPAGKMPGYRKMIGQDPKNALGQNTGLQADVLSSIAALDTATPYVAKNTYIVGRDIFIPLQFWFCRNIGLALPLIVLQYHDVRIQVSFREAEDLIQLYAADTSQASGPVGWVSSGEYKNYVSHNSLSASLWVDYVFLDADERRRFAQVSHEYLIEQVQYQQDTCLSNSSKNVNLTFSHPVKELLWVAKGFEETREWSNFTNTQLPEAPPFQNFEIQNNQLIEGLTGLPSETYISPSKLNMTITTPFNITELLENYFTIQKQAEYVMLNGDAITINANGDTSTNVTLIVLNTVAGVANQFLTNDVLVTGLTYNKIISILRTTHISFPEKKVLINLLSAVDKVPFLLLSPINTITFTVSTLNFIMTPGDILQISNADKTQNVTLVVSKVDTNGIAIEFFLRTPLVNNILYNTVISAYRTGAYISTSIVYYFGITVPSQTVPAGTELTATNSFVQPGSGYTFNIGDIFTCIATEFNITADFVVSQLSPLKFVTINTLYTPATALYYFRELKSAALINKLSVLLSVSPAFPTTAALTVGSVINSTNSIRFFVCPSPDYMMKIGDIVIIYISQQYNISLNTTKQATLSLKVTKVNNSVATEFMIMPNIYGFSSQGGLLFLKGGFIYNQVLYVETYNENNLQTNLQHPALVLDNHGQMSDIKTYDDLMRFSNYDSVRPYNSVTGLAANPFTKALLTMNGAERFAERPGTYFSLVQAQKHHTNIPVSPGINVYSFALKPEEHQPSGTCNFSRVEDAKLRVKTGPVYQYDIVKPNVTLQLKIFAINYNILRIVNGMGGLAYN